MIDDLDIPDFLRITQDERKAAWARFDAKRAVPPADYAQLASRALEAHHAETRKRKSRGRVATMLARKNDRAALDDGMVWDVQTAKWIKPTEPK